MKIVNSYLFAWKTAFIIFSIAFVRMQVHAQCADVQAEYKVAPGGANKCGNFAENEGYASTPPKFYLQSKTVTTETADEETGPDPYSIENGSYNTIETYTESYLYCTNDYHRTGSASYAYAAGSSEGDEYSYTEYATVLSDNAWSDDVPGGGCVYCDIIDIGNGFDSSVTTTTSTTIILTETASSHISDGYSYDDVSANLKQTSVLSDEFTDGLLRSKAISSILDYPSTWTTNYAASFGAASYILDTSHIYASVARMKYHFHVTDCQLHTSYLVTWDEVTTYPDGTAPSVNHMQEEVEGNGDPVGGVYTSDHVRDVPGTPSTITVDNITITYSPFDLFAN
jgi:hypothetical protein